MIRISNYQLFCLIMLFEIGSSILFVRGIEAKQDAWLAVMVGTAFGLGLMWVYTEFQSKFPQQNLAEMIPKLLGNPLGIPLVLFYGLFFLYCSAKNFHEFGILLITTFLIKTPIFVILLVFMLTALYVLFLGFEVLARTSEFFFPVVAFFIIGVVVMICMSGKVEPKELTPILANGWKPIFKEVYPGLINFPFGEAVVFTMYWGYLNATQPVRRISLSAIGISGLTIALIVAFVISVLGVAIAKASTIAFLAVIKLINIGNIITNLDALGIVLMFIGGFYKMILFFYGGVQAFGAVLKKVDTHWIMSGSAIFVMWFSIDFEPSFPFHAWSGLKVAVPYIHHVFQTIIPLLLLTIYWLKIKSNRRRLQ